MDWTGCECDGAAHQIIIIFIFLESLKCLWLNFIGNCHWITSIGDVLKGRMHKTFVSCIRCELRTVRVSVELVVRLESQQRRGRLILLFYDLHRPSRTRAPILQLDLSCPSVFCWLYMYIKKIIKSLYWFFRSLYCIFGFQIMAEK